MSFDSFDLVVPPDYGDLLCLDCARVLRQDHPEWDDPEDQDGNMRPVFDIDEVPQLEVCGHCGYISRHGSFGPEAVDTGITMLAEFLTTEQGSIHYLDEYAERLVFCNLGDGEEGERNEVILDQYRTKRSIEEAEVG